MNYDSLFYSHCLRLDSSRLDNPSPSFCSPQRRADQRSTRSTRRSARRKHPRHQGETPRSRSCRAPFLSHHAQAYCNIALAAPAPPLRPAAVQAGWVSVDLRCVFSHGLFRSRRACGPLMRFRVEAGFRTQRVSDCLPHPFLPSATVHMRTSVPLCPTLATLVDLTWN